MLRDADQEQLERVSALVRDVLGSDTVGACLFGSAVLGGLQRESDLDMLVVSKRQMTREEKQLLVDRLLAISGRRTPQGRWRRVELTIVVESENAAPPRSASADRTISFYSGRRLKSPSLGLSEPSSRPMRRRPRGCTLDGTPGDPRNDQCRQEPAREHGLRPPPNGRDSGSWAGGHLLGSSTRPSCAPSRRGDVDAPRRLELARMAPALRAGAEGGPGRPRARGEA